MKRLSSSGFDDLNLGASFAPGAIIRLSVTTRVPFFIIGVDDDASGVCELVGFIDEDMTAADNNCFSASSIFLCRAAGTDLLLFVTFGSLERPFSEPAL
jgi:hypothetical protein